MLVKLWRLLWQLQYFSYRRKYDIHPSFRFNGEGILFYGDGDIICGKNSYIGRYSSIQAVRGYKVIIGENTAISSFVRIYTCNRVPQDFSEGKTFHRGNVIIGDNVWIGTGVFIREGVKIGDNAVIGANSVITRDIPAYSVAVGAPARVIKQIQLKNLKRDNDYI